jgi:tetratricopeptide (TPR) repeat protein
MIFTKVTDYWRDSDKQRILRLAATTLTLVLLNACSNTPDTQETPEVAVPETAAAATTSGSAIVLEGPDENPYLTQTVDVPKAAQQQFNQAINAMAAHQWPSAEQQLQQLTANYPTLSGPYLNLGIVYRQTNRLDKAEEAFKAALTANTKNLEAYNQLAYIKREQGDFKAAEANYLSALQVWPKHPATHKNLGILYDLYLGQWDKALDHFRKYDYLVGSSDKTVAGWIIDLQRRLNAAQ